MTLRCNRQSSSMRLKSAKLSDGLSMMGSAVAMVMTVTKHYSDRSRYECGGKCARKRYWNYHYDGLGVVPASADRSDLLFGSAIHALIEEAEDGSSSADPYKTLGELLVTEELTPDGFRVADEWESLYTGLRRNYLDDVRPALVRDYEFVASEDEMTMELAPGVHWMSRLDGVWQRRSDGLLFLMEAKTTSWPEDLMAQAKTNFQLLMEMEALRRGWNLKPDQLGGALLLVFNKGKRQKVSAAEQARGLEGSRRLSPFCYWYRKTLASGEERLRSDWSAGYEKVPTWEAAGPDWLSWGREQFPALKSQVQLWDSVGYDSERTASVIRQVLAVEHQIADYGEDVGYTEQIDIDTVFPQNFGNCHNDGGFRRPCEYFSACFSPNVGRDPIGSGEYVQRTPNHPQELS